MVFEKTIVVDGRGHLLGRLASIVAKELLLGCVPGPRAAPRVLPLTLPGWARDAAPASWAVTVALCYRARARWQPPHTEVFISPRAPLRFSF